MGGLAGNLAQRVTSLRAFCVLCLAINAVWRKKAPNREFDMVRISVLKRLALFTALLLAVLLLPARSAGADDDDESAGAKFSAEAAATFNKRCTACHTLGKGIKAGPDL